MKKGKIIILSAPSGSGKSTIIKELMKDDTLNLLFSISATSRLPRGEEKDGKEYYFLTKEDFESKVRNNEFVEWEEVYSGTYYGTLESEVKRITEIENSNLIMDIDVKGALNVKKRFQEEALTIFIMPPSLEELKARLVSRATDSEESINKRLTKADYEIKFASDFDKVVINDKIETAVSEVKALIRDFS